MRLRKPLGRTVLQVFCRHDSVATTSCLFSFLSLNFLSVCETPLPWSQLFLLSGNWNLLISFLSWGEEQIWPTPLPSHISVFLCKIEQSDHRVVRPGPTPLHHRQQQKDWSSLVWGKLVWAEIFYIRPTLALNIAARTSLLDTSLSVKFIRI